MAHENRDEGLIRRYLLGRLADDELQQLEERMMAENEFYDRVLLAEDEMVEEYVEKKLSKKDRLKFDESFRATPSGRRQIAFQRALSKRARTSARRKKSPWRHLIESWFRFTGSSSLIRNAAIATLVLAVTGNSVYFLLRDNSVSKARAALVAVYSNQRPTYFRLSGFRYAPFVELMGNAEPPHADRAQRERVGLLVQNAVDKNPHGPAAIHLLGQYYLAGGDLDEAISELRKARDLAPNDADILNDLGGALFEKARRQGLTSASNSLLNECLLSLNRAIEIKPTLAEAYFNRALCNELLMQWQSAEADWQYYLSLDSTSPWADEAREGLKRIEEQRRKNVWYEPQMFDDFVAAAGRQDSEAGWRSLCASFGTRLSPIVERLIGESNHENGSDRLDETPLKWAGQIMKAKLGDRLVSDISDRYTTNSESDLGELQKARKRFADGVVLFQKWKLRSACDAFDNAALQYERVGDLPEASYARYLEAHCYLRVPDLEAAQKLFDNVRNAARVKAYVWLESRADDGLAEVHFSLSEYSLAIEFARRSLELSRLVSNAACISRSSFQLSEIYLQLGDYSEAGNFAWEGLKIVNNEPVAPLQSSLPYEAAADLFTAARLDGLAIAFQVESLRRALSAENPVQISFAYSHVGRLYAGLLDRERAVEQIDRAREIAAELPRSESGDARAFASLCAADLYRVTGDLDRAISTYDEALNGYSESERHNEIFAATMGKLLCHIKKADTAQAKDEMLRLRDMIERFADEIVEEKNRTLFTENLSGFHDAAIAFAYFTLDEHNMAYQYAEMFRARSLFDLATSVPEKIGDRQELMIKSRRAPATLDEIKRWLPKEVQLVQYAVLDQKSVVWVFSNNEVESREIPISKDELTTRARRFVELCRNPEASDVSEEAASLYEILIQPIESLLSAKKQLCIVPDNCLSSIPFIALRSPRTNRYLIEDYVVSSVPSATLFITCTDWATQKSAMVSERALSVGDPEFNHDIHKLNRLPDAASASGAVAGFYSLHTTLIGRQATESAVTAAMGNAQVINLATHYVIDSRSPMLSRLVLSPDTTSARDDGGDASLHGYDLYGMRLPNTKLVVLAGCQTLGDQFFNFEGAVGAARPFISAGVPLVVASLWPVDSKATADLVVEFHRQRKPGVTSSAQALQAAQLAMIRSENYKHAPFYWAGFSLIGGYADF